jgi:uncharacterized membrane-anchored protein
MENSVFELPEQHPERVALNDEIHARPPESLVAPLRLSFLALTTDLSQRERQWEQVCELARRFGAMPPKPGANHYTVDFGPFRVKWERHTEFARYKFIVPGVESDVFAEPAIEAVPQDWLAKLDGEIIVAAHVSFIASGDEPLDFDTVCERYFRGDMIVGGGVAGGAATAVTDFRIQTDGFSRFLVQDRGLTARQAGRTIQRLLEIDAYRMMALLALPVARGLAEALTASERELEAITERLARAEDEDEASLLERLTRLEADIEIRYSKNLFRFAASDAYYGLVLRRIAELREVRVGGLQTIEEFMGRRLTPAMNTCRAVAARQESLSQRVARASQLLSTRVDISRQAQNQDLLASMNRRAALQLRLQETVEGLSVAAGTYYISALVGHIAQGFADSGAPISADLVEAVAIPFIAVVLWFGIRRIRKIVSQAK